MEIQYQDISQCLKSTSGFFGRTYQNICNGTQQYIPNGFWDYAAAGSLVAIGVGVFLLFAGLFVMTIRA